MAAPRPKKTVKKAKPKAKDDNFSRFKKSYKEGKVKVLANPPPMPGPAKAATVVKLVSKAAKDLRSTDPKSLRNKALREANRAANQNKPKYKEKIGPNRPQGPEAPKYSEKIGPNKPAPSTATSVTAVDRSLKSNIIGEKASVSSTTGAGRPEFPSSNKSKKASVSPMTGAGRPEYPSSNNGKKTSGNKSGVGGPGGARALENVSDRKSGTSKAAKVGGSAKSGVGRQTKYQRNETAMEQKRSSNRPKKSIFSLFRKG